MTHSGVSQAVEVVRGRFRERLIRPRVGWRRAAETVWGPLLTLAALIVLDLLARAGTPVLEWFPVLLLTVVISGYLGGLRTALISAVLTVLYGIHFLAEPGMPLRYQPSGAMSLLVVGLIAPGVAVLVSRLHSAARRGRDAELSRAEAEALDRRVSLLSQASTTLASSLDYEVTLRELARALVPTLGDWCTIHAIDERNTPHFIAGAHRDPARDLLVRVLCEYGERRIPFGAPAPGKPIEVTEELLRALAQDDEHRKLYRSLKPSWVLPIPLRAQNRLAGVLTLGMSREYARAFGEQDVRHALELGERVSFAVGAGHVFHQAREAERRLRLLFEANPQPMWIFDVETLEFLAVNDAAVRHYGYSRDEFLDMTIMDVRPAEEPPASPFGHQTSRPESRLHPAPAEGRHRDRHGAGVARAGAGRAAGASGAGDRHQRADPHPRRAPRQPGAAPPGPAARRGGTARRRRSRTTSTTFSPRSVASGTFSIASWTRTTRAAPTRRRSARRPTAACSSPASSWPSASVSCRSRRSWT